MKHTPGPWKICGCGTCQLVWDSTGEILIHSAPDNDETSYPTGEQAIANARLISAAPEMFEAIHEALKEWDILPGDRSFTIDNITDWLQRFMAPAMEKLRLASEKAEGE